MAALTDEQVAELFDARSVVMAGGAAGRQLGDDADADAACVPGVGCGTPARMRELVEQAGPGGPMVGGARRRRPRRQTRRRRQRRSRGRGRRHTVRRIRWPSGRWGN